VYDTKKGLDGKPERGYTARGPRPAWLALADLGAWGIWASETGSRSEDHGLNTFGRHLLVEYYDCDEKVLDDLERIEELLVDAAKEAKATVVRSTFHRFAPQGVSGVIVIEESHLSIHTWPEHGYAAVDFYTCGDASPDKAHPVLRDGLKAQRFEMMVINRGVWPPRQSLKLVKQISEGLEPALRAVGETA